MTDDRLFSLIALLCVLAWLLAQSGRISARASRRLTLGAAVLLGAGLVYALLLLALR